MSDNLCIGSHVEYQATYVGISDQSSLSLYTINIQFLVVGEKVLRDHYLQDELHWKQSVEPAPK